MTTPDELLAAVDAAFVETGRGLASWPDPHPDRSPADDEYSRATDAQRWRIVGARAEAWLVALAAAGLAEIELEADVRWEGPSTTIVSRTDRAVPRARGALPLVVARSQVGAVDDAGVTLGVGDPAVLLAVIPDCGCDACDSGSQDALDELDEYVLGVVTGAHRSLWRDGSRITVISPDRWTASGVAGRRDVDAVLARPDGWHDLSGAPWMTGG